MSNKVLALAFDLIICQKCHKFYWKVWCSKVEINNILAWFQVHHHCSLSWPYISHCCRLNSQTACSANSHLSHWSQIHARSVQPSVHVFSMGRWPLPGTIDSSLSPLKQKDWGVEIPLPNAYVPWHHLSGESRLVPPKLPGPLNIYLMHITSFINLIASMERLEKIYHPLGQYTSDIGEVLEVLAVCLALTRGLSFKIQVLPLKDALSIKTNCWDIIDYSNQILPCSKWNNLSSFMITCLCIVSGGNFQKIETQSNTRSVHQNKCGIYWPGSEGNIMDQRSFRVTKL